jgi:hypothetical protein
MFNINFLVKNKKLSITAFIVFLVIVFGLMIRKADHLKSVAFTKNGVKVDFYDLPQSSLLPVKVPKIDIFPATFSLSYPNPSSPSSLHGTFVMNIANKGAEEAIITDIKWKIIDGDRPITPPDEWRKIIGKPQLDKFYLPGHTGMRYIYGPEIGASGKNKITLSVEVKYINPLDKKKEVHTAYYTGTLRYDKNLAMNYSGSNFDTISKSQL